MGIELTATIIGLAIQVFVTVFTIGHFFGKSDDRLSGIELVVDGLKKEYIRINREHEEVKKEIATSHVQLGADIGFFGKELKELKDTFKEFTKEMREWRYEVTNKK